MTVRRFGRHAVMAMRMAGFRHDARVVPALGQQERDLGVGQQVELVDGMPGRHVVELGPDGEQRHANVGQRHGLAARMEPAFGEIVVEEQVAQILGVHPVGHPRRIGVPRHEVGHRLALAHQVVAHRARPDEVVGAQDLECAGHLLGVEEALFPHHVFEERKLALVDEQRELARFLEVGLRGEEAHRLQPLVAVARHRGRGDRQQGAAEAIADRVHLLARNDRA